MLAGAWRAGGGLLRSNFRVAPTIQVADASAAGLKIKTMRTPTVSHLTVFRRRGLLFYQFDAAISRSSVIGIVRCHRRKGPVAISL